MADAPGGRRLAGRLRRRPSENLDLTDRADELTGHVFDALIEQVPAFGQASENFRGVVRFVVGRIVEVIATTFREGRPATRKELRELVDMTVPGAELGITLEDMLEVFHVALDVLWGELHRLADARELTDPKVALDMSYLGVHLITELSRGVTKAYLAGDRIWLQRGDAEQALVEGVLAEPPRIEPALRAARALALPVFEDWQVAVYLPAQDPPENGDASQRSARNTVARTRREVGVRGAVGVFNDAVVLALATDGKPPPAAPDGWCVGISRTRQGTVGIRAGHDEAREAAVAARRRGLVSLHADDALLDRVFTGAISTADLAAEVLAPLDALPADKAGPLVETLEAWLDASCSATAAARALNLHPQSLRYRLKVLRGHLGDAPLDDPEARLRLHLAIKSRRLT